MTGALPHGEGEPLVGAADHLALPGLETESTWRVDEGQSSRLSELCVHDGALVRRDTVVKGRAAPHVRGCHRHERQCGLFRAWCAKVWWWVLLAAQAMAACDLTGQLTGWVPARDPVVPDRWADGAPGVDEPPATTAEVASRAVPERRRGLTSAELVRLSERCARYQANRVPFTTRELAHLHFVRWLHQTGRITS